VSWSRITTASRGSEDVICTPGGPAPAAGRSDWISRAARPARWPYERAPAVRRPAPDRPIHRQVERGVPRPNSSMIVPCSVHEEEPAVNPAETERAPLAHLDLRPWTAAPGAGRRSLDSR